MPGIWIIVDKYGVERTVDEDRLNNQISKWEDEGTKVEKDPDRPGGLRTDAGDTITNVSGGV
jgi:hypothetical protein